LTFGSVDSLAIAMMMLIMQPMYSIDFMIPLLKVSLSLLVFNQQKWKPALSPTGFPKTGTQWVLH
jgi:hypothetical protein